MDSGRKFQTGRSRQRAVVIAGLLTLPTIRQVSVESTVSVSTIQRWLRDSEFIAELNAAKAELTNGITAQLRAAASRAVQTLAAISDNPVAPEPSRVAAASRLVEFFLKTSTLESIEARLSQLESGAE
jgi:hypothetical protein